MALIDDIDEYRDAMRESICSMCVARLEDRKNPDRCVYEGSGQCSLFAHLPEVVEAVTSVSSDSMDAYTQSLRRRVCAHCDHQNAQGICNLRDNLGPMPSWCVLDAYFNLIVGVIEDVQAAQAGAIS